FKCVTADFFESFFFSSRRRHTRSKRDWSSDVCSSDLYRERTLDIPYFLRDVFLLPQRFDKSETFLIRLGAEQQARIMSELPNRRSEERRVGKECRARGGEDDDKRKRTDRDGSASVDQR